MQIPFGSQAFDVPGIPKDEWRSVEGSTTSTILDRFAQAIIPQLIGDMRTAVLQNDIGKAREIEGYCAALEDLSDLLREGLSSALDGHQSN